MSMILDARAQAEKYIETLDEMTENSEFLYGYRGHEYTTYSFLTEDGRTLDYVVHDNGHRTLYQGDDYPFVGDDCGLPPEALFEDSLYFAGNALADFFYPVSEHAMEGTQDV